jgi:hypothetical protein
MNYAISLIKKWLSGKNFTLLDFEKVWEGTSGNGRMVRILHLMNYDISLIKKWLSGKNFTLLDFEKVWRARQEMVAR